MIHVPLLTLIVYSLLPHCLGILLPGQWSLPYSTPVSSPSSQTPYGSSQRINSDFASNRRIGEHDNQLDAIMLGSERYEEISRNKRLRQGHFVMNALDSFGVSPDARQDTAHLRQNVGVEFVALKQDALLDSVFDLIATHNLAGSKYAAESTKDKLSRSTSYRSYEHQMAKLLRKHDARLKYVDLVWFPTVIWELYAIGYAPGTHFDRVTSIRNQVYGRFLEFIFDFDDELMELLSYKNVVVSQSRLTEIFGHIAIDLVKRIVYKQVSPSLKSRFKSFIVGRKFLSPSLIAFITTEQKELSRCLSKRFRECNSVILMAIRSEINARYQNQVPIYRTTESIYTGVGQPFLSRGSSFIFENPTMKIMKHVKDTDLSIRFTYSLFEGSLAGYSNFDFKHERSKRAFTYSVNLPRSASILEYQLQLVIHTPKYDESMLPWQVKQPCTYSDFEKRVSDLPPRAHRHIVHYVTHLNEIIRKYGNILVARGEVQWNAPSNY